jgi:ankyrin repeat protein
MSTSDKGKYFTNKKKFLEAVEEGDLDKIKKIFNKPGFNVNVKDKDGNTPLIIASREGHTDIVKVLLDKGADIDVVDKSSIGTTALIIALKGSHTDIAELLVEKGADVKIKDRHGFTALMCASYFGYTKMVKLLIEKGADINAKEVGGKTAFDLAKNEEIRKLLGKMENSPNRNNTRKRKV